MAENQLSNTAPVTARYRTDESARAGPEKLRVESPFSKGEPEISQHLQEISPLSSHITIMS
jgi:hypothetical protein